MQKLMRLCCSALLGALLSISFALPLHAKVLYELNFAQAGGDAEAWFEKKGWKFEENMSDMGPRFEHGQLLIEPTDTDLGAIVKQFNSSEALQNVKRLRIEWGVNQYSDGADWSGDRSDTRNTREPVSLMVFFGTEKMDSGSYVVPNLPYFLSFFLGKNEKPDQEYYGNYWQEGGRYFCIPCDGSTGKTFVTEVALSELFQKTFSKSAPAVTGLTIEVDAKDTNAQNGKHSSAFIKKIELLSE